MPKKPPKKIPDYKTIVGLRNTDIDRIARRHVQVRQQMKELQEEADELRDLAVDLMLRHKLANATIMIGDIKATQYTHVSVRISAEKLLELGVSQKRIDRAKTVSKTASVRFSLPEEEEAEAKKRGAA